MEGDARQFSVTFQHLARLPGRSGIDRKHSAISEFSCTVNDVFYPLPFSLVLGAAARARPTNGESSVHQLGE